MTDYTKDDVHTSAMLVELRVSQWTARKQDKRVANAVATANQVNANVGSYYKSLIDPTILETLKSHVGACRSYHYLMTLPWSDEGPRVLPASLYFDYMAEMSVYREKFSTLADQILRDYPYHREQAKLFLGGLFSDADYPEPHVLAGKYAFSLRVNPLPKGADFRCDIGGEEIDKLQSQIEEQTNAAVQHSVAEAFNRVLEIADRYAERLSNPTAVFRDTLVENARELAAILPRLNFTNDPDLARVADDLMTKLTQHDPNVLRHNKTVRAETAAAAQGIISDIENIFGGGR